MSPFRHPQKSVRKRSELLVVFLLISTLTRIRSQNDLASTAMPLALFKTLTTHISKKKRLSLVLFSCSFVRVWSGVDPHHSSGWISLRLAGVLNRRWPPSHLIVNEALRSESPI
ncbi:hypothetical protein TNCV_5067631 [Trichonephila clavipes]|uniref:Secreted protein n=1 Tax=Trichonephila clavipes TaxID=2585209 RepID=A0A8X6US45_TRICX|nr:hypothetical protein TNCV_5067631 [Trichonephila clavipes]